MEKAKIFLMSAVKVGCNGLRVGMVFVNQRLVVNNFGEQLSPSREAAEKYVTEFGN